MNHTAKAAARLAFIVPVLLLLATVSCDGERAQEIARLSAEVEAWRGRCEGQARDNEELKADLKRLGDRNLQLQTEKDALERRLAERPAPTQRVEPQAPPQPAVEEKATSAAPDQTEKDRARLQAARDRMQSLAGVLFARDQLDLARSVALTAVQLGSDRAEVHFQIAYCEAAGGNYEAAAQSYERALRALDAQEAGEEGLRKKCLNNYGVAAAKLGDTARAETLYVRALSLDPQYAPTHFNLGLLYADQRERAEEAVQALRKHIVYGGSRGTSARELILRIQQSQQGPEPTPPE